MPPTPPKTPKVVLKDRTGLDLVVKWEVDATGDVLTIYIDKPTR